MIGESRFFSDVLNRIDFSEIDSALIPGWCDRIRSEVRQLNRLRRQLEAWQSRSAQP